MLNIFKFMKNTSKDSEIEIFLNKTNLKCKELSLNLLKDFGLCEYAYNIEKSAEELGLEKELIKELIEEYVVQILDSKQQFLQYIKEIQTLKLNNKNFDYTPLRHLAHKNLGVAKNLDIEDAQKILYDIKTNDNIECLFLLVELLEISAIRLNPECAYRFFNKKD